MKKIILLLLVFMVPFLTMGQKRSKKSKKDNQVTSAPISYEFMVIKGVEIDMSNGEDQIMQEEKETNDVSLERRMKRFLKTPIRLVVAFEGTDMRSDEIRSLMSKSNELRTMSAAVEAAAVYGWEFINANTISDKAGIIHYYYMRRDKK